MNIENTPIQGITLYSHADDFRSHWIRFLLAEKQIKYHLIITDHEDEDLADLNPYNQLPMLIEQNLKLFHQISLVNIWMIAIVKISFMRMLQWPERSNVNIFGVLNKIGSSLQIKCLDIPIR
jgi:hypothetical protein